MLEEMVHELAVDDGVEELGNDGKERNGAII